MTQRLSITSLRTVFGADQVYEGDVRSLVAFADLFHVAVTRRVAVTKYAEFEQVLTSAFSTLLSGNVTVEVVTQEDYVTDLGEFVYNLLFVVRMRDYVITPLHVPMLPDETALEGVNDIEDLNGNEFELVDPAVTIYRHRNAFALFALTWVARSYQIQTIELLQTSAEQVFGDDVTVRYSNQEWFYDASDDSFPVRFNFFIFVDGMVLSSQLESDLNVTSLPFATRMADGAENLRESFTLRIQGLMSDADFELFEDALDDLWGNTGSVQLIRKREMIGFRW